MAASTGRYRARFADGPDDVAAAQALRHEAFIGAAATPRPGGRDADAFDAVCRHVLVEEGGGGPPVCTFRLLPLESGAEIGRSYSAQHYDLARLSGYPGRLVEVGRFCIRPGLSDPDILRVAWGLLTRMVDAEAVAMLFGCSSFRGTDPVRYRDAFALLAEGHIAPRRWLPRIKAPEVIRFGGAGARGHDGRRGLLTMPPLLRSYLAMGGWVSDHAVIDRDLGTLHVFTGLEIAAIPAARARILRAAATG